MTAWIVVAGDTDPRGRHRYLWNQIRRQHAGFRQLPPPAASRCQKLDGIGEASSGLIAGTLSASGGVSLTAANGLTVTRVNRQRNRLQISAWNPPADR
ncbi:MAG UNVERIFIED_CONTAM: hypothetical protein LVR18_51560 [Planctomycetaceae bacterium]